MRTPLEVVEDSHDLCQIHGLLRSLLPDCDPQSRPLPMMLELVRRYERLRRMTEETTLVLNPCPYCGGRFKETVFFLPLYPSPDEDNSGVVKITCTSCLFDFIRRDATKIELAAMWNKRAEQTP